ncbi:MAG TPA: DUF2909 family protein [Steroidobacteraceae bacterium]
MDIFKILVLLTFAAIVASLGKALFHLSAGASGERHSAQFARALVVRIALSLALFALLMLGWYFGRIAPHGLG